MSVGKSVLDKERQRETWGERWERQRERENREGERSDGGGGKEHGTEVIKILIKTP